MTRLSAEEQLIVAAFKKWCRDHKLRPGHAIAMDARTFFLSLGANRGDWEKVLRVLKKHGLVE